MVTTRIRELAQRYFAGTISSADWEELAQWVVDASDDEVNELLEAAWKEIQPSALMPLDMSERILSAVYAEFSAPTAPKILRFAGWRRRAFAAAAAAVILIVVGVGSYLFFAQKKQPVAPQVVVTDVKAPETNRARIKLGNGQTVYLDSAANGTLAKQGNVTVVKLKDGQIAYNGAPTGSPGGGGKTPAMVYNTLTNPRGSRVINITLSDGSQVWLNAESSLRYPMAFSGDERKVEITGEAYFEVSHTPPTGGGRGRPFIVSKGNVSVTVLGTHFNVNAYEDESSLDVTLLEGSVKVTKEKNTQLLKPGEQAQIKNNFNNRIFLNTTINTEEVMAWKNGLFKFNQADIEIVMRQLARWYDVEVSYPKGVPKEKYWGGIPRTQSLAGVFKILEESGAHFTVEGRKVTVLPK